MYYKVIISCYFFFNSSVHYILEQVSEYLYGSINKIPEMIFSKVLFQVGILPGVVFFIAEGHRQNKNL